ncbi:MAG: hypothetical protein H6684_03145 [Deltaproteobacteria bacterium]|nr:hypothetical protein [Deltaproteobacteria bacterium]
MRVLIIGAGAIGQAFGYHFQQGGAQVAFLVKPKYADEARAGFTVYPMNRPAKERLTPVAFTGFDVETDLDEAAAKSWDLIAFCMSTVALMSGDWFERLSKATGATPLLLTQPGESTAEFIRQRTSPERCAWVMLAIMSFQSPLPGEHDLGPGVAFWYPPASGPAVAGPKPIVDPIVKCLAAGGMPVRRVENVQRELAYNSPILDGFVLALEIAGFSFDRLRREPELLKLAHRAMKERWAFAKAAYGGPTPFALVFIRPLTLRLMMRALAFITPFNVEKFFDFHYRKVAAQTLPSLTSQIEGARAHDTPHEALSELERRLRLARGSIE